MNFKTFRGYFGGVIIEQGSKCNPTFYITWNPALITNFIRTRHNLSGFKHPPRLQQRFIYVTEARA